MFEKKTPLTNGVNIEKFHKRRSKASCGRISKCELRKLS